MFRHLLLSSTLVAACGLAASEAHGAPAPATSLLATQSTAGAADCPDPHTLAAIVNDGLGRTALAPAGSIAATVTVAFDRTAAGYEATVRVGDGRGGTRKLADAGPGCGALASAVGILLELVLDSGPEPAARPPAVPPSASVAQRPIADVGFGGGVAQGLVGGWSPALGLGGRLTYHRWAARLGGVWLPPSSNAYGPGRVEVGLAAARLAICVSPDGGGSRLTLGFCAQQQIGWMRGRGIDYEASNRAANHLWLATGVSIVTGGPLGRSFGWEVEVAAIRVVEQQRFVVDNLGTAFQSDPVAFMTTFGFTTRVW